MPGASRRFANRLAPLLVSTRLVSHPATLEKIKNKVFFFTKHLNQFYPSTERVASSSDHIVIAFLLLAETIVKTAKYS